MLQAHGEGSDGAADNLVGHAAEVHDSLPPPEAHVSEERMAETTGERGSLFPSVNVC